MYPSDSHPGYGVFVRNFVDSLKKQDVIVDSIVIRGRSLNAVDKLAKYFMFGWRVIWKGLFGRYDCIYVHYLAHSLVPVLFLRKITDIPLVCNAHGEDLLPRSRLEKFIFGLVRNTIASSRVIVVPSEYFASIAKAIFPDSDVFISPSAGVDLNVFRPVSSSCEETLNRPVKVGYVSRIDDGKGWDVLLAAVRRIREKYPELALEVMIVGEGTQTATLKEMIATQELTSIVKYLGAMPQEQLPKFYSSLDVFIFPTVRAAESLGLVGLEALACGTPAICSDIGGVRTYMRHGINGYLFPPGNVDALADAINTYIHLPSTEKSAMRTAARASVVKYDRNKVTVELLTKLHEAINR